MLKNNRLVRFYRTWAEDNTDIKILPLIFIVILIFMTIVTSGRFLSIHNINAMAYQLPELGLFAFAMMITMVTGGINLSIISSANFSGVLMALLMTRFSPPEAPGNSVALLTLIVAGGLLFSLFLGLLNGLLIAYVEVSPVLATLSTMILYEGLTLAITKGYVISDFPPAFLLIGNARLGGIPVPFLIFIGASILMWVLCTRRPLGRYLFMIGSNSRACAFSGINVKASLLKCYMISSLLAGMASVIMISRFNSANARYGASYTLLAVLISVLGGTNPDGGSAKVLGIVLALFSLQALTSGFNLLEISSFVTVALWGVLLTVVIAYSHYAAEKRNRRLAISTEKK